MNDGPYRLKNCTVLDDGYNFHRGLEIGLLYVWMKSCYVIKGWFLKGNQEQVTLMANQMGWHIRRMYSPRKRKKFWFYVDMKKKKRRKQKQ